jgi:hypothetical protein
MARGSGGGGGGGGGGGDEGGARPGSSTMHEYTRGLEIRLYVVCVVFLFFLFFLLTCFSESIKAIYI